MVGPDRQTDGQTDKHHGNSATIFFLTNAPRAKKVFKRALQQYLNVNIQYVVVCLQKRMHRVTQADTGWHVNVTAVFSVQCRIAVQGRDLREGVKC